MLRGVNYDSCTATMRVQWWYGQLDIVQRLPANVVSWRLSNVLDIPAQRFYLFVPNPM